MAERDIMRALLAGIKALRGEYRRAAWLGRKGAPDLYIMVPVEVMEGRHDFWVETKAPYGVLSPHQRLEIALMRSYKVPVLVISTLDEVDELIGTLAGEEPPSSKVH